MIETEIAQWSPPRRGKDEAEDELATLRAVPLFQDLKDSDLRRIMKVLHVRQYAAGEVVFREGQTGAGMYVIQHGEVDIVLRLEEGTEKHLVTLRDRQFFGELALLESAPRSASCVVRKNSTLLGIFQSDLEQLIDRDSKLGARVLWNLARLVGRRLLDITDTARRKPSGYSSPTNPVLVPVPPKPAEKP